MTREITIETTETIVARHEGSVTAGSCPQCVGGSRLIPFAEVVTTLRIDPLRLHAWLSEGLIHFQLSEKGDLAICWNTLSRLLEQHPSPAGKSPLSAPGEMLPLAKRIDRAAPDPGKSRGPRRSS